MRDRHQKADGGYSRRHFLQLTGSAVSAMLLGACTAPLIIPEQQATIPPTPERQELIFWGDKNHPMDRAAAGFVAAHPDIQWLSPHPDHHFAKIQAAFAAGAGLPDLYWAETPTAQAWGCQELLADLTDELQPEVANYHPAKLAETFVAKHKMNIGWPGDVGVVGWCYRADKLEALGWRAAELEALTWPAFITMVAELRQQGLYLCCFPTAGWSLLFFLILHQVGGTAINQAGKKIMVSDEKGVQAMQLVKQLWEAGGGLNAPYGSESYWIALKEGLLLGDFVPTWAQGAWEANVQAPPAATEGPWRIAPLPGGEGIAHRTAIWGGAQLVTPKAAPNPENARLFMHYALASVDGAARYAVDGILPAYRPYLQAEACQGQRSPLFGDWPLCEFWAGQEKDLSPTYFRPAGWDAVNVAVQQEMMAIVRDAYSVEDGMSRIIEHATPDFEQTRCA